MEAVSRRLIPRPDFVAGYRDVTGSVRRLQWNRPSLLNGSLECFDARPDPARPTLRAPCAPRA